MFDFKTELANLQTIRQY